MILESLYALYNRLVEDPSSGLPKPGFCLQNISFKVVLTPSGSIKEVAVVKNEDDRSVPTLVPGEHKPSGSGINPCFLCDNTAYMLGYSPKDKTPEGKPERTLKSFEAFRQKHLELESKIQSQAFSAVCRFLEQWDPVLAEQHSTVVENKGGFGLFQIEGQSHYVHEDPKVVEWISKQEAPASTGPRGTCLITGKESNIAVLHNPAIKGVIGAQTTGAKLVSFNLKPFESYGKEQGYNAPVSGDAAFAYCSALNYLLASKQHRFRLGDTTAVFWTDKPSITDPLLSYWFDAANAPEDTLLKQRLEHILESAARGQLSTDSLGDTTTRFYFLGLAPNAARLSVRFWYSGTLGELTKNLQKHQNDLSIVRMFSDSNSLFSEPKVPSVFAILRQTARDADGIPPLLSGALVRSILEGTRYPDSLYQKVISRTRVQERDKKTGKSIPHVSYLRAAVIKAYLNRNHNKNLTMSLDTTRTDTAYLLGRLFCVLDKTQEDTNPGQHTSIHDRFFSVASTSPGIVFPRLLKTYNHHLRKLDGYHKINREKLLQEIMAGLSHFPTHLNLQDQGVFAVAYYHQRKDFFTKKTASTEAA